MAKLSKDIKALFSDYKEMLDAQGEYAFMYNRNNGVSAMAVFTGRPKNHVRIIVTHCGKKDTFKKKIGFMECVGKLEANEGIVLPAHCYDLDSILVNFLELNFEYMREYWEQL